MRYVGPIAYKGKLTVDHRGIDLDTKIHFNEGAKVTVTVGGMLMSVGTVDWVWDHGSEIWAALELEKMPSGDDDFFPQVDLMYGIGYVEFRNAELWYINEVTVIGCHLGNYPIWTDLPPVKPS